MIPKWEIADEIKKAQETAVREYEWEHRDRAAFAKLRKNVEEFEEASGIKLDGYDKGKALGEIVKFINDGKHDQLRADLEFALKYVRKIEKLGEEAVKAIADHTDLGKSDYLTSSYGV